MSENMRPLIQEAVEAAKTRHGLVLSEYVPVESPSGILNRIGISQLYSEKYGNDQELIDWRLRMHSLGTMALTDTLIARLESEAARAAEEVITGELVERSTARNQYAHVDQYLADPEGVHELLAIFHAVEDYANNSLTHAEYRQRQNEACRYFHDLSKSGVTS